MNKFLRPLAWMLVIVLCLVSFAACTQNADTTADEPKATDKKTAASEKKDTAPAVEEPVEVTWYTILPDQPGQQEVFDAMNEIYMEQLNATVNIKNLGGAYEDKVTASIASGEAFDICFTSSWKFNYYNNIAKGAFLPLDDLLAEYGQDVYNIMPPGFWEATKVEGKIYAVPNQQIAARSGLFEFDKDQAAAVGMDPSNVTTIEECEEFMQAVYEETGVKSLGFELNNYVLTQGFEYIAGHNTPGAIDYSMDEVTVINYYKTDMFKDYLAMQKKWVDNGWVHDADVTLSGEETDKVRKAGEVSCLWGGTYKPGGDVEISARFGTNLKDVQFSEPVLTTGGIIATMQALSVTSENPEKAMEVLNLTNTDVPLYNLFAKGIEGRDYKMTGDGTIEILTDTQQYNHGRDWAIGNVFNAYRLPGQPDDVWIKTDELNQNAKVSPLIGFAFNPEPVKDQIANCASVYKEYEIITTGSVDLDVYYTEFVEKMDNAGADIIIAEMQAQIDAFLAGK